MISIVSDSNTGSYTRKMHAQYGITLAMTALVLTTYSLPGYDSLVHIKRKISPENEQNH